MIDQPRTKCRASRISIGAIVSMALCGFGAFVAMATSSAARNEQSGIGVAIVALLGGVTACVIWFTAFMTAAATCVRHRIRRQPARLGRLALAMTIIAPVAAYFYYIWWPTQIAFVSAAQFGNREFVERALWFRLPINAPAPHPLGFGGTDRGETPLTAAAISGRIDMAELLLAHGADVNAPDGYGRRPLTLAGEYQHPEFAAFLLAHGADVNAKDSGQAGTNMVTALHWAARLGDVPAAQRLLSLNIDVNAAAGERPRMTPLMEALEPPTVRGDQPGVALLLAEHGADGHVADAQGNTAISIAASRGYWEMLRALTATMGPASTGTDQFYAAMGAKDEDAAIRVLDAHRDLVEDAVGSTGLLRVAVLARMRRLAVRLLRTSSVVDQGVLENAARSGDEAILSLFSAATPKQWDTVVVHGAATGDSVEVESAISRGADINALVVTNFATQASSTALYAAAEAGNVDIIKLLLNHGADVNLGTGRDGMSASWVPETPLDVAVRNNHVDALRLLISRHAIGHHPPGGNGQVLRDAGIISDADFRSVYGQP